MKTRQSKRLIREGDYVAEVDIDLLGSEEDPWAPYLSLGDMEKLDQVRECLRRGDLQEATGKARVFRLTPVSAA